MNGRSADLVQLEAKGLGELSLVVVEGVEGIHAEFKGRCHVQQICRADAQITVGTRVNPWPSES
jgi:hypothetical protein